MSDLSSTTSKNHTIELPEQRLAGQPGRRAKYRPITIPLPNGKVLEQRSHFAHETLGVSDKTVQRMNFPTTYLGNVAYVDRNESLEIVAARTQRRNQPPTKRRGHR